jgi:hypothetical protein
VLQGQHLFDDISGAYLGGRCLTHDASCNPAVAQEVRAFFFPIAVSCQSGCLHNEQCHSAILIDFRKFEFKYFIYFEFVLCGKVLFMAGPPCQPLSGLNMSYRGTKRRKKYFDEESIRTSLNFSHVSQK